MVKRRKFKKNLRKKPQRTWPKSYWLLITLSITLLAMYLFIFYSHRYGGDVVCVLSFFMTLAFPITLHQLYLEFESNTWYGRLGNSFLTMICIAPFILGSFYLEGQYYEHQLKTYPRTTTAKVSYLTTHTRKGHDYHYAVFEYTFNGRHFTQDIDNDDHDLAAGDSLTLTVSDNDPEIFRITERWRQP